VDYLGALVLLAALLMWLGKNFGLGVEQTGTLILTLIGGYVLVRLKRLIMWGILAYQRFAPEHVRRACVFEPSCSEYMLRALERYGLVAGLVKGIGRLLRCHDPNGGVDEP
jgi:putative component of membrane protein insertase Oxa1/YidC/SpoIIIJ protein YidD